MTKGLSHSGSGALAARATAAAAAFVVVIVWLVFSVVSALGIVFDSNLGEKGCTEREALYQ